MLNSRQVLIVSSDRLKREKTGEIVGRFGLHSARRASLLDAHPRIQEQSFQFALCGDDLPDCNLRTAASVLTPSTGGAPVIVRSHLADWDASTKAMTAGTFDSIACPPEPIEMDRILRLALAHNPPRRGKSHTTV